MKVDTYILDALMRDLVGHGRSAASFLVYLFLYRQTLGIGRESYAISYSRLADATGLSKRAVQSAVEVLVGRQLLQATRERATSTPVYTVLTPWRRLAAGKPGPI